ncbi:type II secretion system F family protein [Cryobacterium sp. HLT2-28]|uniref:type II secretion system F family protein n=1 Tax=Cryobacterium sp. HLT2-28 TaxID=1259146 RepID=UPI00106D4BFD|nr:type II secretion system F family protein [Cryobacterium sp. HLT2-28]TFB94994.1 type II secretion system protein F [Cryobacterium sp. HLT2-28]
MSPVLYAGIAAGLLALLVLVFLVIAPSGPKVPLERRRAPGTVAEASTLTRMTDRTVEAIDVVIRRRASIPFGAAELEQAGIRMQPSGFVLMVFSAATVLALVGLLLGAGTGWTVPLMVAGVACAPIGALVVLRIRTARRRAKFADQLDESLGLLAGALRAGHGLLRAVDAVSQETESPTTEEFARVVNETRIGRDLSDALDNTALRMRSDDFQWVAQAIAINREVGGNLSQVLDQVGHTIRERNQLRRQVKALAAEGKMSAYVLIALPIGVFSFLLMTQPSYFNGFLGNIWGTLALVVAAILLIVGSIWMMAVVKVKF